VIDGPKTCVACGATVDRQRWPELAAGNPFLLYTVLSGDRDLPDEARPLVADMVEYFYKQRSDHKQ
jgi:hypothetical protein